MISEIPDAAVQPIYMERACEAGSFEPFTVLLFVAAANQNPYFGGGKITVGLLNCIGSD